MKAIKRYNRRISIDRIFNLSIKATLTTINFTDL